MKTWWAVNHLGITVIERYITCLSTDHITEVKSPLKSRGAWWKTKEDGVLKKVTKEGILKERCDGNALWYCVGKTCWGGGKVKKHTESQQRRHFQT